MSEELKARIERLRAEIRGHEYDKHQFESDMEPVGGMRPARTKAANRARIAKADELIAAKQAEIARLEQTIDDA